MSKWKIPYWALLVGPILLLWFGYFCNFAVMAANHGQMPVLWPGGCTAGAVAAFANDPLHSCGVTGAHLKVLTDWLVWNGVGVVSPGDMFEWAGERAYEPCLLAWAALMIVGEKRRWLG